MGIETEYGISVPGRPQANPMILSGDVVRAYARGSESGAGHRGGSARPVGVRWDYAGETPLADARGYSMHRLDAHVSMLTDEWEDDPGVANLVLTNGARLYVDHAHPEYSAPEVVDPMEALVWDRAGEQIMAIAAGVLAQEEADGLRPPGDGVPVLYKNNTDGKGASYGTHENYLMRRDTPFAEIVAGLTPFFVVRQIICGAGRVGLGQRSQRPGYQLASRSDFFEAEVGLETTFKRPIINTRDEPHAAPDRYRRLHVILGDANLCDVAGLLKMGTTSLVLGMIEDQALPADLRMIEPLRQLAAVSHDPSLRTHVVLADGTRLTGLDLHWRYLEAATAWLSASDGWDAPTRQVMDLWEQVLTTLGRDVLDARAQVDWVAKLALLQGYRERDGLEWDAPRLAAIDFQWSDMRPGKGVARTLERAGRIDRLTTAEEVAAAVDQAPASTRAWFRGECVRRYGAGVAAASWESVVFEVPGHDRLQRLHLAEPHRGTRALVGELLDRHAEPAGLLAELRGERGDPG
ncbi:putative proteasome accessory factor [Kineosphaera limosa NBRC 100340]|uniref:Putative proteasome accessory factor n=2 Tax=Kineosphaera TaxID=211469 RepID=K6WL64_9MICO|nr:putative proteasome accessory factor [Kineosphaera limosa NBRC 100340]